jgi:hypothetical protein
LSERNTYRARKDKEKMYVSGLDKGLLEEFEKGDPDPARQEDTALEQGQMSHALCAVKLERLSIE